MKIPPGFAQVAELWYNKGMNRRFNRAGLLPPPAGASDWAGSSRDSYCVDRTLIIKDPIDSKSRVALFTRPGRFGKTTVMEMIRAIDADCCVMAESDDTYPAGEVMKLVDCSSTHVR